MDRKKERILDEYQEKHPFIGNYMECVIRAYSSGLAGFGFSAAGTYALQHYIPIRLPYSNSGKILVSCLTASAVAYKISLDKCKECQSAWMVAEGKQSHLTPSTDSN